MRAASSPAEREQRANRGGVVGIRKAEPLPNNITNDEIHYALALPSASASAISADFVRLLRPIYNPLSFAPRAPATTWQNLCALICQAELYRLADFTTLKSPPITPLSRATRPSQPLLAM